MCELSTKGLCPSAQKVVKTTKRKAIVLSSRDPQSKIKVELETEEDVKFPNPSIDQESLARLEVMPKEEESDLQVPKPEDTSRDTLDTTSP